MILVVSSFESSMVALISRFSRSLSSRTALVVTSAPVGPERTIVSVTGGPSCCATATW
jgi:hypothetical protein